VGEREREREREREGKDGGVSCAGLVEAIPHLGIMIILAEE
jgi:hypothetical protein